MKAKSTAYKLSIKASVVVRKIAPQTRAFDQDVLHIN